MCVGERKSEEENVEAQLKRNKKWKRERKCWKNAAEDSKKRSGFSNVLEALAALAVRHTRLSHCHQMPEFPYWSNKGHCDPAVLFFFCSTVWWRVMACNKSMSSTGWGQERAKKRMWYYLCSSLFGLSERHQWSLFTATADTVFRFVLGVIGVWANTPVIMRLFQ